MIKNKNAPKSIVVHLRFLERSDLPKIVNWLLAKDYREHYLSDYPLNSESQLKNQLLKEIALNKFVASSTQLLVAEAQDSIVVGLVILKNIDLCARHLDLQIYVPPDFALSNIPLLVADAAYNYVFKELNMHKVYNYLQGEEQEKIKVHEKRGHEPEAVLYDFLFDGKQYHDLHIYAIYKKDILPAAKAAEV